jgi:hypothetical protein
MSISWQRLLLAWVVGLIGVAGVKISHTVMAAPMGSSTNLLGYTDLTVDAERCGAGYRIQETLFCTHGADPAPDGVDPQQRTEPLPIGVLRKRATPRNITGCEDDGMSGKRVQILYVRTEDSPDRYAEYVESIRLWAISASHIFDASAHQTGGHREIRFVLDVSCLVDVRSVTIPSQAHKTFKSTITALKALGYQEPQRKYLLFVDANIYCGIATVEKDSRGSLDNFNNNMAGYARVDNGCWMPKAIVHELVHTLGGIQHDAPHASGGWHCTDEQDLMCYSDWPNYPALQRNCPEIASEQVLDCGHDDYFHTNPAPGAYLATHWNVANSEFLAAPPIDAHFHQKEAQPQMPSALLFLPFIMR